MNTGDWLSFIEHQFVNGACPLFTYSIAFSLTYTSGLITKELLLTNNLNPTKQELKILSKKYKEEAIKAKKEYEEKYGK